VLTQRPPFSAFSTSGDPAGQHAQKRCSPTTASPDITAALFCFQSKIQ
jgi:hypothetical protein